MSDYGALYARIEDHLIQHLNKFPDSDGKGTPFYNSVEEYILAHGTRVIIDGMADSTMLHSRCYQNSESLVLSSPLRYLYVEGYTLLHLTACGQASTAPVHHAWVYDTFTQRHVCPTIMPNMRAAGLSAENIVEVSRNTLHVGIGCVFPIDPYLDLHSEDDYLHAGAAATELFQINQTGTLARWHISRLHKGSRKSADLSTLRAANGLTFSKLFSVDLDAIYAKPKPST